MSKGEVNDGDIAKHNPAGLERCNELLLIFPCLDGIDDVEDVVAIPARRSIGIAPIFFNLYQGPSWRICPLHIGYFL